MKCVSPVSTACGAVPELDGVAVAERRELVLGPRAGAEVDGRARAVAQLQVPGHEVGVEVREQHVADPHAEPAGVAQVLVDVALRVDDRRRPAALIRDEIGGVGEAAQVVALEDHLALPAQLGCGTIRM